MLRSSAGVSMLRSASESLRSFAAVFANTNLRRVQLAGVGSTFGAWIYTIGIAVYAYESGGARAVGILFAARWGCAALTTPWLSVLADRGSRRNVMLAADLIRVALMAAITALAYAGGSYVLVFVLAVCSTCVSAVFGPAQAALMPTLVDSPEQLTAANAVMNTVSSVGMFVAPAIGGLLLALSGPGAVFAVTLGTFLWSASFIVRIPADRPQARADERESGELVAGFRAIGESRALRLIVGLTTAQMLLAGALEVLITVVAFQVLGGGNGTVGWLNMAIGIGCLLGVLAVAGLAGRKRLAADFGLGCLLWGVPVALTALAPNLGVALLLFALSGVADTLMEVSGTTLLQRSADEAVLGRVFGVLASLSLATLAVGAIVAPGLVSLLGARGALVAVGAVLPVLLALTWNGLKRVDAEAHVPTAPLRLLGGLPLFAPLPPTVLERLASAVVEVHVPAMAEAVAQGGVGDRFYVIRSGRATVEVDGAETGELGPGDFFGEIALLREVPRTATVRALEPLELYGLERDDFLAAVTGHAPSRAAADSIVAQRLPAGAAL